MSAEESEQLAPRYTFQPVVILNGTLESQMTGP
jgi:hypothetical protein